MASTTTNSPDGPDVASLSARLARAAQVTADAGAAAMLVTPGSDLRYLIGTAGGSFERLTCLAIPATGEPVLVVPKLEAPGYADVPLNQLGVSLATWVDGQDDPYALAAEAVGGAGEIAVSDTTPALHVFGFREALPGARQRLAGPILRRLRMRKDAAEVAALRAAGAAIDRVHARMGEWLRPGRTEAEVGADIAAAVVAEGHDSAEFVIVGSGPHGASPHHAVSDRVIQRGDIVVVDIGGPMPSGYNSDSTRTYAVGTPAPEVAETYAVLERAQRAAVEAVRPGATAHDVDATARAILTEAGIGERFIHRIGHGIGLDVHEEPYIMAGNDLVLEPGMAFSVEPGVYFAGEWGARIEDIVVTTESGCEPLNTRPHELAVLQA